MQFSEQCKRSLCPNKNEVPWSRWSFKNNLNCGLMAKQFLIDLPSSPRIQAQNEMNLCAVLWGAKTLSFHQLTKVGEAIHRKSTCQDHKMNTHLVSAFGSSPALVRPGSIVPAIDSIPSLPPLSLFPAILQTIFQIVVFLFTTLQ